MGVTDGQPVDAATTNPAFLDANNDDTALGKITFNNISDPTVSGAQVVNIQREMNGNASFTGQVTNTPISRLPSWTNNDVGSSGDNLKSRSDLLTQKFNETTGHAHDGSPGNGAPISGASVGGVPLEGYFQQGTQLTGVTGGTEDVSTPLASKTASTGQTVLGVVSTSPFNRVIIRNTSGAAFTDLSGNEVYARLTNSGSTWTLTFYSLVSGTETAYIFLTSTTMDWYYQELFNPLVSTPVYSELAFVPSDNIAAGIPAATTTTQGKVLLPSGSTVPVSGTGSLGTANATVANADHTHEGVHALLRHGDATLYKGNVTLKAGTNIALSDSGGEIQIDATTPAVNPNVEYRTITSGEATAGQLTLVATPTDATKVILDVIGVGAQIYSVDYAVSGNVLNWSSHALASVLDTGDILRIIYFS